MLFLTTKTCILMTKPVRPTVRFFFVFATVLKALEHLQLICQLGGRYVLTVCTLRCAADVRRERRKLEFEKDVSRFQLQVGITPLDTCVGREPVMYRLPKKLCKRQATRETDRKLKIDCKLNAHYWIFLNTAPCVSHC